jgi:hypothetical protein
MQQKVTTLPMKFKYYEIKVLSQVQLFNNGVRLNNSFNTLVNKIIYMSLDMGWVISLSLASIIATIGVLSIINILVRRSDSHLVTK